MLVIMVMLHVMSCLIYITLTSSNNNLHSFVQIKRSRLASIKADTFKMNKT